MGPEAEESKNNMPKNVHVFCVMAVVHPHHRGKNMLYLFIMIDLDLICLLI